MTKTQEKLEKLKTTSHLLLAHKMGRAGLIICTLFLLPAIFAPVLHAVGLRCCHSKNGPL